MGGYGSGRRIDSRKTTESQCQIDVRVMKKQGALAPGASGNISWWRCDKETGTIGYRADGKRLILNYQRRQNDGEWQNIEQVITLTWTHPNYGGKRTWFLCPHCCRRVAILYGGNYFFCRCCHNLSYSCQQESREDRLMRRARNIRCRLGGGANLLEPFPLSRKTCTGKRMRSCDEKQKLHTRSHLFWLVSAGDSSGRFTGTSSGSMRPNLVPSFWQC